MRVVVSGGSGFLGSHLCEALLRRGDRVCCLDDFSSGRAANVGHLLGDRGFECAPCDVTARVRVSGEVDAVFHLASGASPRDHSRRPLETLAAGSRGTENLLRLALRHQARFVLASTGAVYGDPEVHPQDEDYRGHVDPVGPRSVHDEAKRFAEALSMAYRRSEGADVGIVRIFNTYGPRMRRDDGRVVPTFIRQALDGEDLTIFGDGSQTRSFCYVADLIRGLVAMADAHLPGPFNLGSPSERTVRELAELVLLITGSDAGLRFRPRPADDPVRRRPVITRAHEGLGWQPRVPLEEGLIRTASWFATQSDTSRRPSQHFPVGRS
jgi:dTDP-glucose 4,6-dehydratase